MYEQHPFWCTGYTFWDLHSEAPDLFLHLSRSDLVFFKGDLNHRKLTYDCAAPASTPFDVAIGPMASSAGAPKIASLRTIKSDVVVGLGAEGDEIAEKLDEAEPGWKISGKYVSCLVSQSYDRVQDDECIYRPSYFSLKAVRAKKCALLRRAVYPPLLLLRHTLRRLDLPPAFLSNCEIESSQRSIIVTPVIMPFNHQPRRRSNLQLSLYLTPRFVRLSRCL